MPIFFKFSSILSEWLLLHSSYFSSVCWATALTSSSSLSVYSLKFLSSALSYFISWNIFLMFSSPAVNLSLTSELLATIVHRLKSYLNEYMRFWCRSASASSICSLATSPSISFLPLVLSTTSMHFVKLYEHSFSLYFVASWVNVS